MEEGYIEEALVIKDKKKTIRRFLHSLAGQKVRLIIVLICVACYSITTILAPLYSATVVDLFWNEIKECRAAGLAFSITWENGGRQILLLLILYGVCAIFYSIQMTLMASFAETLNLQLRTQVAEKLQRLPLSFYDCKQTGAIMSNVTNDLEKMAEALQTGMIQLFIAIGTVIGSVVMMFTFSVRLTLVFLGFTAVTLLVATFVSRRTLRYASARQEAMGNLNALIEESYTGRNVITAFNYQKRSSAKVHAAAEKLARATQRTDFLMNAVNPGIRLVNRLGLVVIALLGGMMLLSGAMTPGVFQAFFQYVNQAGEPITEMSYMINSLQSAFASIERVYDLLDAEEMAPDVVENQSGELDTDTTGVAGAMPFAQDEIAGDITFSHVKFGYTPEKMLMRDVNFHANSGQKIAIVGSTGAGKTTLVNLLMRFYEIDGGAITLDGMQTSQLSRHNLRDAFGMVLQDTWLFEGTIAENIAYAKPGATMEEIRAAAKAARADFFIRTLPRGYETRLENDAENISIGQRQLLTIARVFLRDPAILILDEATSSVDTRTELEIGKAMQALMQGRTSFVIAHRLSTIVDADLILVMEGGDIIEQGNHRELLAAGGAYATLYNSQFA